jgi:hypothetical protein
MLQSWESLELGDGKSVGHQGERRVSGMMVHAYNSSYSGGGGRRIISSSSARS